MDHLPLGPHQNIYLLDIAGEIVVLGVTEQNVIKIMDIDDPTLSEEMRLNATLNASASAESAARNWRRFWPGPPAKTKEKINLQVKNALPYSFHRAMEEQLARVQSKPKDEPDE